MSKWQGLREMPIKTKKTYINDIEKKLGKGIYENYVNEAIVNFLGEFTDYNGNLDLRDCLVYPDKLDSKIIEEMEREVTEPFKAVVIDAVLNNKYEQKIKVATTYGELFPVPAECVEILEVKEDKI